MRNVRPFLSLGVAVVLSGVAAAQVSPLPPPIPGGAPGRPPETGAPGVPNPKMPGAATPPGLPAAPATGEKPPPPPEGLPSTAGVPYDPSKVKWPTEVAGRSISEVVSALKSDDPTKQEESLRMIRAFGPEVARKSAMKAVLALVDDPDPGVKTNAILLVGAYGFENEKEFAAGVDRLAKVLARTPKGNIFRLHLIRALSQLGPEARDAIPALVTAIDDPSWEVRASVAEALGRLGAPAYEMKTVFDGPAATKVMSRTREASLPAMQRLNFVLIKDRSSAVRMEACRALISLGPPQTLDPREYLVVSKPLTDAIAGRIRVESEAGVKVWLNLLHMMYDERVFDAGLRHIAADVRSADVQIQMQAMSALMVLGPKALPALSSVSDVLHSGNTGAQVAAIQTMIALGEDTAAAVLPEFDRFLAATAADPKQKDIHAYAAQVAAALRKASPEAVRKP